MVLTACGGGRGVSVLYSAQASTVPQSEACLERARFALVERADRLGDQARRVGQSERNVGREVRKSAVVVLANLGRVAVRGRAGSQRARGSSVRT